MKHNKIVAIAIMLMMALTPLFAITEESEAVSEEAIEPTGFALPFALLFNDDYRMLLANCYYTASDVLWEVGDFFAGVDTERPAGEQGDVNEFALGMYSQSLSNNVVLISKMATALVDNDRRTWTLTESYLNRAAEISAGDYWSAETAYHPDTILTDAGIYDLVAQGLGNTIMALTWAYKYAANVPFLVSNMSSSNQELYSSIDGRFSWDGGRSSVADYSLDLILVPIVTSSASKNLVYYYGGELAAEQAGTATSMDGRQISISAGFNAESDLSDVGMVEGWYTLTPGRYAGLFLPSASQTSADIVGGAVMLVDGVCGFIVPGQQDDTVRITWNHTEYSSESLSYIYEYNGDILSCSEDPSVDYDILVRMIRTFSDYYGELGQRIHDANVAASRMWSITEQAKSKCLLLSPSSVIPQLRNIDIDDMQAYAMYVSALDQIAQYYNTYGGVLGGKDIDLSDKS
ncbi:MAG: hypothetical protein IJT54_08275, partial [Candidatus Methanomethylophilaceae archaeon]|nr:hypothetical protein [Candidatus Methanomethylophilaceae archaeon]